MPATSDHLRGAMFFFFFEFLGISSPSNVYQELLHWRADLEEFLEPVWASSGAAALSDRLNCHGNLFIELCVARVEQRRLYKSAFCLLAHQRVPSDGDTHVAQCCSDVAQCCWIPARRQ